MAARWARAGIAPLKLCFHLRSLLILPQKISDVEHRLRSSGGLLAQLAERYATEVLAL